MAGKQIQEQRMKWWYFSPLLPLGLQQLNLSVSLRRMEQRTCGGCFYPTVSHWIGWERECIRCYLILYENYLFLTGDRHRTQTWELLFICTLSVRTIFLCCREEKSYFLLNTMQSISSIDNVNNVLGNLCKCHSLACSLNVKVRNCFSKHGHMF